MMRSTVAQTLPMKSVLVWMYLAAFSGSMNPSELISAPRSDTCTMKSLDPSQRTFMSLISV